MNTTTLTFAFFAGTLATVNPCGFALLPAYLVRRLGSADESRRGGDAVARALGVGGVTTAGFLLVFATLGTAIAAGARQLTHALRLASFRDKPIVLNAWASWCTGCAAEARALAQVVRSHPRAQVIGIDIQDSKGGAKSFYRRFDWRHPSIFDPSGKLAVRLGVRGLPTTLFLDRQHRVVEQIAGETNLDGFVRGYRASAR